MHFLCSEKTAKLEELQDKNIRQKEVLRDMTAKREVLISRMLNGSHFLFFRLFT